MKGKDNPIKINDAFSQLVKQKLENLRVPVADDVWEGIEQQLMPQKKRRVAVWYLIAGGLAAGLALMLLIYPFNNQESNPGIAKRATIQHTKSNPKGATSKKQVLLSESKSKVEKVHTIISPKSKIEAEQLSEKIKSFTQSLNSEKTSFGLNGLNTAIDKKQNVENDPGTIKTETQFAVNDIIAENQTETVPIINSLPDLSDYPKDSVNEPEKRKKKNWLLAAAIGAGNNSSLTSPSGGGLVQSGYSASNDLINSDIKTSFANVLNVDDYTDIQHLPPVSFGALAAIPLNTRWSLESGLVYTYMESKFKKTTNPVYLGNLKLHYLGIPLNLRAKIWKTNDWNVYVAFGSMIEKGIRSVYTQDIDYGWSVYHTRVYSGIDGFQWSFNTGFGVNYLIQKKMSLFFEPKISYYFKNNQPMSSRTAQPFIIGLNGGIRFEL